MHARLGFYLMKLHLSYATCRSEALRINYDHLESLKGHWSDLLICRHCVITCADLSLESQGHISKTLGAFTWIYLVEKSIRKCCSPFCIFLADLMTFPVTRKVFPDRLDLPTTGLADQNRLQNQSSDREDKTKPRQDLCCDECGSILLVCRMH